MFMFLISSFFCLIKVLYFFSSEKCGFLKKGALYGTTEQGTSRRKHQYVLTGSVKVARHQIVTNNVS